MNSEILMSCFVGHLVGDYLLQTDWMALNKKLSHWPCLLHCMTWTLCVSLFSGIWSPAFVAFLFVCHFAQDRTHFVKWWVSLKSAGFAKEPFAPWSLIVVDNSFHVVQMWIAVKFLI